MSRLREVGDCDEVAGSIMVVVVDENVAVVSTGVVGDGTEVAGILVEVEELGQRYQNEIRVQRDRGFEDEMGNQHQEGTASPRPDVQILTLSSKNEVELSSAVGKNQEEERGSPCQCLLVDSPRKGLEWRRPQLVRE